MFNCLMVRQLSGLFRLTQYALHHPDARCASEQDRFKISVDRIVIPQIATALDPFIGKDEQIDIR